MRATHAGSIRLFQFSGIQVYLHWSWLVVAVFRISAWTGEELTFGWATVLYLSLFAIVLMHEFGHSLACRQTGGQTHDIILWPLGGIAYVSPPPRPGANLWSIAAGPLVNVLLVPVLLGLAVLSAHAGWNDQLTGLRGFWRSLQFINFGLIIFNLLPVYPLDGGQILRSLLWFGFGRARSLQIAAWIGLFAVAGFIVFAVFVRDIWLAFIALFLGQRCWLGLREAKFISALERAPRHAGFACPTCHQAPPGGPIWGCRACRQGFDPFSTGGVCPHCGTPQPTTACLNCGASHPIADWHVGGGAVEPPVIDV